MPDTGRPGSADNRRRAGVLGLLLIHSDDVSGFVSEQMALAVVEEHQLIVPRVCDNRALSNGDVEWLYYHSSPRPYETLDRNPDILNGQIGFRSRALGLENQFTLGVGKAKSNSSRGLPNNLVAKRRIKLKRRVQIRHAKCEAINLAKERLIAHLSTVRRTAMRTFRSHRPSSKVPAGWHPVPATWVTFGHGPIGSASHQVRPKGSVTVADRVPGSLSVGGSPLPPAAMARA
jgi:hypothetical protein